MLAKKKLLPTTLKVFISCVRLFETPCTRFHCPWNFPGKNTGVVRPFPSPEYLPNPGTEPRPPELQADSLPQNLSHSGKESACNAGDAGLIPGSGRSPGGGMATHSSIFAWKNPMDRRAWQATVHGVAKSRTRLKLLSTPL